MKSFFKALRFIYLIRIFGKIIYTPCWPTYFNKYPAGYLFQYE